jgi:neopullulanase
MEQIALLLYKDGQMTRQAKTLFQYSYSISIFLLPKMRDFMSFIRKSIFIILVLLQISFAQQLTIEKIEPPNWWTGMKLTSLQLMVYGKNLKDVSARFEPDGIKVVSVEKIENPDYAFINIRLPADLKPAEYKLILEKKGVSAEIAFPVLNREKGIRHQGFDQEDVIYLIMPDRFADGDKKNNNVSGFIDSLNREKQDGRHGGDIQGLINNLKYFQSLGVTSLWLTPLVENNTPMSYHGYGATDFYKIDPRLGSNKLYKTLVEEAHKNGLKIILDHVANHFHKNHSWMKSLPVPGWIHGSVENHLSANHHKMVFADPYRDSISIKKVSEGWFTDYLVDFNQADNFVKKYIIQNTIWWIEYTGLDGVREDTYPYADQKFLAEWASVILDEYPQLNIVGEVWTGEPAFLAPFQKGNKVRGFDSNLPSITDFGIRDRFYDFLTGNGTLFNIYETLTKDYLYSDPGMLVTFIDNHDISRGLFYAKGDIGKMKIALLLLLTSRGIPQIFYGTETNLSGGESHGKLRFDFPGGFEGDTLNYFNQTNLSSVQSDYFNYLKDLLSLRKKYKALSQGKLKHYPPENGIYVYFKEYKNEKFLVVVNEKSEGAELDLTKYDKYLVNKKAKDVLSGEEFIIEKNISVPPQSGAIYKIE